MLPSTLCSSLKRVQTQLDRLCSVNEMSARETMRAADRYLPSDAVQVQCEQQCPAAKPRTGQSCLASCMARTNHHHIVAVLCISMAEQGCCLEGPSNAPGELPFCSFAPCLSFLLQRDYPNSVSIADISKST